MTSWPHRPGNRRGRATGRDVSIRPAEATALSISWTPKSRTEGNPTVDPDAPVGLGADLKTPRRIETGSGQVGDAHVPARGSHGARGVGVRRRDHDGRHLLLSGGTGVLIIHGGDQRGVVGLPRHLGPEA